MRLSVLVCYRIDYGFTSSQIFAVTDVQLTVPSMATIRVVLVFGSLGFQREDMEFLSFSLVHTQTMTAITTVDSFRFLTLLSQFFVKDLGGAQ